MAILTPLLHQVQAALFIMGGLLGLGAVYGLIAGAEIISDGLSPLANSAGSAVQNDQRLATRTACDMPLELQDAGAQAAGHGRLLNISSSGACFTSTSVFLKDEIVIATLPTMRKGANKISGRIIWLRSKPGSTLYGIRLNTGTPA